MIYVVISEEILWVVNRIGIMKNLLAYSAWILDNENILPYKNLVNTCN